MSDERPNLEPTGPFLAAAVICEKVLEDKDGVFTIVRMVDRIIQTASGTGPPPEMPALRVNLMAFVGFKSGAARGRHTATLRLEEPSGLQTSLGDTDLGFEGDDRGANVIVNLELELKNEGLYWIDVLLGGKLITRMPLRLVYQRIQTGG